MAEPTHRTIGRVYFQLLTIAIASGFAFFTFYNLHWFQLYRRYLNIGHETSIERVTIGHFNDITEREHLARYNFAKSYCIDKVVADMACGTMYGTKILRTVAKRVDPYDIEDLGGNFVIDLDKQSWHPLYDVVVSFETLEHLREPEVFLQNVHDTAQSLIISAPYHRSLGWGPRDIRIRIAQWWFGSDGNINPFHKQFWTRNQFQELLNRSFVCDYFFQNDEKITREMLPEGHIVAVCSIQK